MPTDLQSRSAPRLFRLPPRSAVASANVGLARRTVAHLAEEPATAGGTAGRVATRLRRLVAGGVDHLESNAR